MCVLCPTNYSHHPGHGTKQKPVTQSCVNGLSRLGWWRVHQFYFTRTGICDLSPIARAAPLSPISGCDLLLLSLFWILYSSLSTTLLYTCSRREDGLSCRHGVKPVKMALVADTALNLHSLTHFIHQLITPMISCYSLSY